MSMRPGDHSFTSTPPCRPPPWQSGVDTAVMSTHKVLGSLTQAAVLHQQGSLIDPDRLRTTVGMVQTTSPSVSILASIDATRRQMALHGESLLDRTISLAGQARERLQAIPGVSVLDGPSLGLAVDRSHQAGGRCRWTRDHRLRSGGPPAASVRRRPRDE